MLFAHYYMQHIWNLYKRNVEILHQYSYSFSTNYLASQIVSYLQLFEISNMHSSKFVLVHMVFDVLSFFIYLKHNCNHCVNLKRWKHIMMTPPLGHF
jgi:hypothetical protein